MSQERLREPLLLRFYEQFLESQDLVRLVHALVKHYLPSTLARLTSHAKCEVRQAAILALGLIGDFSVNHVVGRAMLDRDATVRRLAQNSIRSIWNRDGDMIQRRKLADTIRLNADGEYRHAYEKSSELLLEAPGFAEVWYQRGSACFQLKKFSQAIQDWHQALELNPYHFVAATAMGEAYLQLGDLVAALDAFRRALRLNPGLERVRDQVARLTRQVEGNSS
ncbi:MAG: tetratricopeptide repeat protein [Pirellulales bacterium]|nr:tetratricopeptide repeat protein [Pirellulales bacterium]